MFEEYGQRAKAAARLLALSTDSRRRQAMELMAKRLKERAGELIAHNQEDRKKAMDSGMSEALLDRLSLTEGRVKAMAEGVASLAGLPDPLGRILREDQRPNGLNITRVSVPIGVIAVIYESRPNVTADSAGLCIRSGNACILRGGREALGSNRFIAHVLRTALRDSGLPDDCVQLLDDPGREGAKALMKMTDAVDLLIPRGGKGLIRNVVENARVPVLRTGEGVCHIYVDKAADAQMATEVIHNAKTSRPSVCNACECILIHRDAAQKALPLIAQKLKSHQVVLRADPRARAILPQAEQADESDWGREYLGLTLAVKVVDSLQEAMEHIRLYGTGHSEAIITDNQETAEVFLTSVDAAAVYHNASTRFTDGGEFGFGAEIGISTQKLHARGPVGLEELTSYKYVVRGTGQIR